MLHCDFGPIFPNYKPPETSKTNQQGKPVPPEEDRKEEDAKAKHEEETKRWEAAKKAEEETKEKDRKEAHEKRDVVLKGTLSYDAQVQILREKREKLNLLKYQLIKTLI